MGFGLLSFIIFFYSMKLAITGLQIKTNSITLLTNSSTISITLNKTKRVLGIWVNSYRVPDSSTASKCTSSGRPWTWWSLRSLGLGSKSRRAPKSSSRTRGSATSDGTTIWSSRLAIANNRVKPGSTATTYGCTRTTSLRIRTLKNRVTIFFFAFEFWIKERPI